MNAVGKPHTFPRAVYRSRMPLWETKPVRTGAAFWLSLLLWAAIFAPVFL